MSLHTPLPSFDEMLALHQADPTALATLRDSLIRDAIAAAPPEHRPALEHTVFRMERAREGANTPLEAAAAAALLMTESSEQLKSALTHLRHESAGHQAASTMQKLRTGSALSNYTR